MNGITAAASPAPRPGRHRPLPWWPWLRRALTLAFFLLVAGLLVRQARTIAWDEVWDSMAALPASVIAAAAVLAACSHLLYATFDLLGRHMTGHDIPAAKVMGVTFVSYAFNLNMGSLVGGVASRYRLYRRLGLDQLRIAQVTLFSMLTNWLGYALLAGLVLVFAPPPQPAGWWRVSDGVLRGAGAALLAVALAYVGLCLLSRRRSLQWRGRTLRLPSGRMALLQLAMSCLNWTLIAAVVYALMAQQLPYALVLVVLLLAAVAGVITHVPAGLGVLEAVFVTLLDGQMAVPVLLGILLAYRTLYYLAPLILAAPLFVVMEFRHRRSS